MKNFTKSFAVIVFSLLGIVACKQEDKPEDAVRNFYDAVAHKNFEQVAKLSTPESTQSIADVKMATEKQNKSVEEQVENSKHLQYGVPEIKGDSAFVKVTNTKKNQSALYTLVKKDGKWLVDLSPSSMKKMVK